MKIILNNWIKYHVSLDTVKEFEKVILTDPQISPINLKSAFQRKLGFYFFHFWNRFRYPVELVSITLSIWKIFYRFHFLLLSAFNKNFTLRKNRYLFVILMGTLTDQLLPYFFDRKALKSIYIFDAWPKSLKKIYHIIDYFGVSFIFVTSSMACDLMREKYPNKKIYWVPEGINPEDYISRPFEQKNIDVLALGRRYDRYHFSIANYFENRDKVYLCEKVRGEIIFPSREEFIDGLSRSKISICVPSNITHPERSGNIETMTVRYLQSMASKCIVLGHAPAELIKLFGYNPVIEINMNNPEEQLESILNNLPAYEAMVEKNYNTVLLHHKWINRWEQIKSIYKSHGLLLS